MISAGRRSTSRLAGRRTQWRVIARAAVIATAGWAGGPAPAWSQSDLPPRQPGVKVPPASGPNSAEDEQAFILDFLEKGYLQSWFAHPASVRQHFANPVAVYWGRRNVPLDEVVQEKLGYARKWIFRFYRLKRDTVRFEPVKDRPNTWQVTFSYDFMADRVPQRSAGVGETTLVLEINGDAVTIRGESGRVLERNRGTE